MDKVNEFEYGLDSAGLSRDDATRTILTDKEANENYRFSSAEDLMDDLGELEAMIDHHLKRQVPRLEILNDYYLGKNSYIYNVVRRFDKKKADHRISHNYAKYISQFIQGYLVGDPVKIEHENEKLSDEIADINRMNDADRMHDDLILDLSKFGRAYELVMRTEDDEDRFYLSDVTETFVIYSDTVDASPIGAVRRTIRKDKNGSKLMKPTLYTATKVIEFEETTIDDIKLRVEKESEHTFGDVQIIEYKNNRFRQGDYETVIPLIDAYDSAESDTANYMTDLNDALLTIIGRVEMPENIPTDLRDANALHLMPEESLEGRQSPVSVEYKYKQYDVAGTEAYKKRISEDIHKFSNTPNMNDENFAGNASGVAMKYKLFGLEQARASKESLFIEGLRKRYKLIANVKGSISEFEGDADMDDLIITLTPNFPEAEEVELKAFIDAGGELSQESLLATLSFIKSPQDELDRIEAENTGENDFTDAEKFHYDDMREQMMGGETIDLEIEDEVDADA